MLQANHEPDQPHWSECSGSHVAEMDRPQGGQRPEPIPVPSVRLSWPDILKAEPRLLDVAVQAARGGTEWDWVNVKRRMCALVGYSARSPAMQSSELYEVSILALRDIYEDATERRASRG